MENHYNCIYMYINKVNGKRYVGQAVDFNKRHKRHVREHKQVIDRAIDKYGEENFEIIILKENLTEEEMNYWEDYYIESLGLYAKDGKGYNIAKGGIGGNTYVGKTEEEMIEIRKKLSESHKEKQLSEETKQKISDTQKEKNNPSLGKLIDRFDKNGNYIETKYRFEYVRDGFTGQNISACCRGKLKSVGRGKGIEKFIFKYHETE